MQCFNCKHWQGNKYTKWGDCFRVIAKLEPKLCDYYLTNDYETVEQFFSVPFDPHELKYWIYNPHWLKLYNNVGSGCPTGVRMKVQSRDDIMYDNKGGERTGKLKLRYFQTHKDYSCEEK